MRKEDIRIMLRGTALGALMYSGCLCAGDISNNVFTVKNSKVLSVTENNKTFIEKDEINCFNSLNIAEKLIKSSNGKASTINVIHKDDKNLQFRKEIAVHDDGHLELTVKMRAFPFTDDLTSKLISYSFLLPSKILDGMKFKAITGRVHKWKSLEGKFGPANGKISQCRYIVFEGEKKSFTFDFNPAGPFSGLDYPVWGEPVGYWDITRNGEYVKFSFGANIRYYGRILTGKVLIYNGIYNFAQKHAQTHWCYSANNVETGSILQFTFGNQFDIKMFEKADCKEYSHEKKWGWEKASNLEMIQSNQADINNNCVASPAGTSNDFIVDALPGCYLLTLKCGHNTQKTGPFNISINGKIAAENIEIPAGETKTMDFVEYLKSPERQIKIGFSGKNMWSLRCITLQAIVFQNEDFSIDRKLWVADKLFSPELEYKNKENK